MFSRLMNPFWAASLLLASLGLAAHPAAASAQDDPGRIHYMAGASDYESGDYQHALGEFQRAYELSQRKQLFYNISLCYQQLGDLEHAVEYLGRYLSEVEQIENRANLERRLENLQRRLDAERAETDAQQTDAQQTDAQQTDAQQTDAQQTDAQGDTQTDHAADDIAAPATSSGANVPAITSFVVGGVGLVMAVAFGATALSQQNACDSREGGADACTRGDGDTMDTFAILSDVGTGLAVVGVGLGLVFLLTADHEEANPNRARLRLAPFASPNAAGLAAQGRF